MDDNAPACTNCKTRPRMPGPDGVSTHCRTCWTLFARAPYCHHARCDSVTNGTRTELVNGPFAAAGAPAHYRCPNGHDHGDLAGWERDSGRMHGLRDALEAEVNPSHRRVLDSRIANARRGTPGGDAYLSAVGTIRGTASREDPAA